MSNPSVVDLLKEYGPARPVHEDSELETYRLIELRNHCDRLWRTHLPLPLTPITLVSSIITRLLHRHAVLQLEYHTTLGNDELWLRNIDLLEVRIFHFIDLFAAYERQPPRIDVLVNHLGLNIELFLVFLGGKMLIRDVYTRQPRLFE